MSKNSVYFYAFVKHQHVSEQAGFVRRTRNDECFLLVRNFDLEKRKVVFWSSLEKFLTYETETIGTKA